MSGILCNNPGTGSWVEPLYNGQTQQLLMCRTILGYNLGKKKLDLARRRHAALKTLMTREIERNQHSGTTVYK